MAGSRRVRARLPKWSKIAVSVALSISVTAVGLTVAPFETRAAEPIDPHDLPAIPSSPAPPEELSTPDADWSHPPPTAGQEPTFDPEQSTLVARDAQSNTWKDDDGVYWKRAYTGPVNYKDSNGKWQPTDTEIVDDGADGYRNAAGPASIKFAKTTGHGKLVDIVGQGWSIGFDLDGIAPDRAGQKNKSEIEYSGALPDASLNYRVGLTSLKEVVVLEKAPARGEGVHLTFPLKLAGLRATADEGGVSLRKPNGDLAARIPSGTMSDATGDEHPVEISLSEEHGDTSVELNADGGWLADAARNYPVSIDPTVQIGTAGSNDTYVSANQGNTNRVTATEGWIGYLSGTQGENQTFMKFDLSSLAGQTILSSRWNAYVTTNQTNPGQTSYSLHPVNGTWTGSTLTWNNRPTLRPEGIGDQAGQGEWTKTVVTTWVQNWVSGTWPNYGLEVNANDNNVANFKKIALAEYATSANRPYLQIGYGTSAPATTAVAPDDGANVPTTTPTLQVNPVTDADGDQVIYYFRIGTSPDANSGQLINSGWLTTTSWQVPLGALLDGVTYYWNAYTWDGTLAILPPWVYSFTVDLGLGNQAESPTDGPVNLATGNFTFGASSPSYPTVGGGIGLSYSYNSQVPAIHGLQGEYFDDVNQNTLFDDNSGQVTRLDPVVDFSWSTNEPYPSIPDDYFLVRWTGNVTVPTSGSWYFGASASDGVRIWVNNTLVLDRWFDQPFKDPPDFGSAVTLVAGQSRSIRVELFNGTGTAGIRLAAHISSDPNGAPVPSDWLTPADIGALPAGWSLSEDAAGSLTYVRALITDNAVTLLETDGVTHEYQRNGSGFTPPEGEDGVLTSDTATGKLVFHGDDGLVYTYRSDGSLESASTTVDDQQPAASIYTWSGTPSRLTLINDPVSNRSVTLTYGGGSCPTPPLGFDLSAPANILCKVTYWDGRATNLYYVTPTGESLGRLARIEDPGSELTDFAYANGKLAKIRDSLAADAVAATAQTGRIDDDSTRTLVTYDLQNRVQSVEGPAPTLTGLRPKHTYAYGSGQTDVDVAGMTGSAGYDRRVLYDSERRVTQDKAQDGLTVTSEWDDFGNLLSTTDPAGRKSTTIYDVKGLPTDSYGPAPAAWFGSDRKPLVSYVSQVPHSLTNYDEGITSLASAYWANTNLSESFRVYRRLDSVSATTLAASSSFQ